MELELRHLRTVRAIADTGSLTKAAVARSAAAAAASGAVSGHTRAAYAQAAERSESCARWLAGHPRFGAVM
ncbi:hypothetical protein ACF1BU_32910 [Streptomyces sp. NPDC014724]|uniref:hypothetical protein n=1 Tax=unclassified Streptomyces TaxID=2593676 RepID=UPI0036F842A5